MEIMLHFWRLTEIPSDLVGLADYFSTIIIRQPMCPVVFTKASAYRLQITLSCAFRCHIVSLQYLSRSSLHRLAGSPLSSFLVIWSPSGDTRGPSVVFEAIYIPAQDHFIFLTVLIISMTFVLSLTQMLVFLSLYVMLSILLSILVCAAASLFCACLVSVQVSAPYIIAGNTQEL